MVKDMDLTDDNAKVGYYAGYIMSAFMIGRGLSSFMCGWLSDIYGRKMVLYVGLWSCLLFGTAFGFSKSFWFAVTVRFCMGETIFVAQLALVGFGN
jgi:MFS family permease